MTKNNCIIISGGPGMGKTSIIKALEAQGISCVVEVGREIILEQLASAGKALPWEDRAAFADLMFKKSVQDFNAIEETDQLVFFDRGIPDTIGYLELCGLDVPVEMTNALKDFRYCNTIFLTPPWLEIYKNDSERKQTFQEAVQTYEVIKGVYLRLKYYVVELPKLAVQERIQFIMDSLNS